MIRVNEHLRRLRGKRGAGCNEVPGDVRTLKAGAGTLPTFNLHLPDGPDTADLMAYCPPIWNQGSTNSCVGQAGAGQMAIEEARDGVTEWFSRGERYDPPSSLFLYWHARARSGDQRIDEGTSIADMIKARQKLGACGESDWSFSTNPQKVNRQPSKEANAAAAQRIGGLYYALPGPGQARVMGLQAAIAYGAPVVAGFPIDQAFMSDRDGERGVAPETPVGPVREADTVGHHAMTAVRYIRSLRVSLWRNSWGVLYRRNGYVWIHDEALDNAHGLFFFQRRVPV